MHIHLNALYRNFGSYIALNNINLDIQSGELLALIGPSGSGKTTLLRAIAGLETVDRGDIYFGAKRINTVPIQERNIGFVFQNYALFKHMTVFENIAFGLRIKPRHKRLTDMGIRKRVEDLLQNVQLSEFASRYPHQLSGGQKQRVALARALAIEPEILLLDEPFSALDAKVRQALRQQLKDLHKDFPITTIFVTHDQQEAIGLADRLVIMSKGKIEQVGTPQDIRNNPASAFVNDFLVDYCI